MCRGREGVGVRDGGEKATFVGRSSPFSFPLPRFCHCSRRCRLNSHQHHQRVRRVMHEGERVWATEDGPSTIRGRRGQRRNCVYPAYGVYIERKRETERERVRPQLMSSNDFMSPRRLQMPLRCLCRTLLVGLKKSPPCVGTHTCSHRLCPIHCASS